jgi:hypothetical protein
MQYKIILGYLDKKFKCEWQWHRNWYNFKVNDARHSKLFNFFSTVPICMPPDNADFTGKVATVSGWGRLKYGGGVPSVLQEVQVGCSESFCFF